MKLYELAQDYKELASMEEDQAVLDTLEGIEGEINDKAQNIGFVLQNMDSDIAAVDVEIKRLQARKKAMTNRKESLKDYLRVNMEALDITKIECPVFSISCRKGRPVANVTDEDMITSVYMVPKYTLDKTKILADLKAGVDVAGAELSTSKSSIVIK